MIMEETIEILLGWFIGVIISYLYLEANINSILMASFLFFLFHLIKDYDTK